jgi:hypothetical protein
MITASSLLMQEETFFASTHLLRCSAGGVPEAAGCACEKGEKGTLFCYCSGDARLRHAGGALSVQFEVGCHIAIFADSV